MDAGFMLDIIFQAVLLYSRRRDVFITKTQSVLRVDFSEKSFFATESAG